MATWGGGVTGEVREGHSQLPPHKYTVQQMITDAVAGE